MGPGPVCLDPGKFSGIGQHTPFLHQNSQLSPKHTFQAAAETEEMELLVIHFLCDYILAKAHKPVLGVGLQLQSSSLNKMNILIMEIKGYGVFPLQ